MLVHYILLLILATVFSLNLKPNHIYQNSSTSSLSLSLSSSNAIDQKKLSKKIEHKLNLKKKFLNDQLPITRMKGHKQSRILKRSTMQASLEDDSDLIRPVMETIPINQRRRIQGAPTKHIVISKKQSKLSKIIKSTSTSGAVMDTKCNSEALRELMLESMTDNSSESKRAISNQAGAKFGGNIDVICSKGHFSYVYSSDFYCEAKKDDVVCIAFKQLT